MIGTNVTPAWGSYTDTTSADGTAIRVWTPRGGTQKWMLWFHPHGQTNQVLPGYWAYPLLHGLINDGWGVVASQAAGDAWGNDAALNAARSAYDWIVTNYGAPAHVLNGAGSMGGLIAMLTAAGQTVTIPNLRGVFLVDGVTSLQNLYNNATYTSSIQTAYGIATDGSNYAAQTSGHDPNLKTAAQFPAIRYRFFASGADTAVNKSANADAMASKLTGRATEVAVVTKLGGHLSPINVDPKDVVAFARRCLT